MAERFVTVPLGGQQITFPIAKRSGLKAAQLGLIINDSDPYSVAIGNYYQLKRGIPGQNIVHVNVPANVPSMNRADFASLKATIDAALPSNVQAIAIAWTNPSRVECNSMTSAVARGFLAEPCDAPPISISPYRPGTCNVTAPSPYFSTSSMQPYTDFQMRPAMMLAAFTVEQGRALIDRGVASDNTRPSGAAYIMKTSDGNRNVRAIYYSSASLGTAISPLVNAQIIQADSISGSTDALFYFEGLASVPNIATNTFPPVQLRIILPHTAVCSLILWGKLALLSLLRLELQALLELQVNLAQKLRNSRFLR